MSIDLRCYGDDIQAVAEMVPDFDLRSPMDVESWFCLLYTSPSPRDRTRSRMPSSA